MPKNAGYVTCGRRDAELLELVVRLLGLPKLLVDRGDRGLEGPDISYYLKRNRCAFKGETNQNFIMVYGSWRPQSDGRDL